jgi:anaerobic magnesium-protoporphyrin IX monomethyl ester cyclase
MIDLLIVHPNAAHGIYGSELAQSLVAVEPPLWPRLIAGYCRDRGYKVKIVDAEADCMTARDVAQFVKMAEPRLVCIAVFGHQPSASTQQMDGARLTAAAIKQVTSTPIIMVGGHVSALPERTLGEEGIDYTCKGEGPITITGLLAGLPNETIPGLVHWHKPALEASSSARSIVVNKPAELLDLSDLHGRAWDLLPMSKYRAHNWQCFNGLSTRRPYASIYTSLGCPWKCSFCCINAPFGGNRYRMRKPIDVVEEIVFLYTVYGVKTFKIIDEMFILNEAHYMEIAERLSALFEPSELNIWAYARVDTVKPHTLTALRRAGFRWLALGIESGSKYVRDGAQKRLKNDDIEQVVREIQAHDINVIGNYIFGLPDDTMESMRETLDLALRVNCEFANFYSAMAYPGSPLYKEALEKGWTLPASWRGYSQHNSDCRPLDTRHISAASVLKFRDEAFEIYFRNPKYLAMVEKKFGADTLEHVKKMTTFKLKRKLIEATFAPMESIGSQ